MAYQRFEIRDWVYLKLSETSPKTTYRATSWNKVFDDTSLEAVSIDTKKLAWLIFNKYHIHVEPVALKKFTVNQLIDYITSNVDYIAPNVKSNTYYSHKSTNSDQRFEIRDWVYLKLSETSPTSSYRATKWNKVFDDTSLASVSIDTKKLALLIFNKYNIQVEPATIKKFTVNQLIDYIASNADYIASDVMSDTYASDVMSDTYYSNESINSDFGYSEMDDSYDESTQEDVDYRFEPRDVNDWIRNAVAKDHGRKEVSAFAPIVIKKGMTSTEWEEKIFKKYKIRIPAQSIEKMDVGDLEVLLKKLSSSTELDYITFGLRNQPKTNVYIKRFRAVEAIDNIIKRENFVIGCFIFALISFLIPIYFVGPNIIKSGIVFSSIFGWIVGIVCWLGAFIGIELIVSKMRPFNRCRIAFSEEKKRLLSHYTLMLFFVLTSSMSLYASQSINLSKVADENISSSSYSIAQFNSGEEIIRDNLKVIIPVDDENRMTAILIVLAVAIAFNITVCTIFRKIVKKFTKMETDGVILERDEQPQTMFQTMSSYWENGDISLNSGEKKMVRTIKIKVTKQLFFYHVLFTILILSTAYFAIIRPIIEIGK